MSKKRSNCPISCWLELFGDKWTLLILRDSIIFGRKNYKDFIEAEEGISTNILADRLKKLVEHGLMTKHIDEKNKLLVNYIVTEKGRALAPIFMEITKWSNVFVPDTYTFEDLAERKKET